MILNRMMFLYMLASYCSSVLWMETMILFQASIATTTTTATAWMIPTTTTTTTRAIRRRNRRISLRGSTERNGIETLDESSDWNRYISDYLQRENNNNNDLESDDDNTRRKVDDDDDDDTNPIYTHMIGIPLDQNHEILLELESIQRGILYHCPNLVHACIAGAVTRMPLLYVQASSSSSTSTCHVTQKLQNIVQQVVQESFFQNNNENDNKPNPSLLQPRTDDDDHENDDAMINITDDKEEGRPLTLQFQNLEIRGGNYFCENEILYAQTKMDDPETRRLLQFCEKLKSRIQHECGYQVSYGSSNYSNYQNHPSADPNTATWNMDSQDDRGRSDSERYLFHPRIPFLRLPHDWKTFLQSQCPPLMQQYNADINNDEEEEPFWTTDQGGNGISPIFWIQWENDVLGGPQRLREVAVYERAPRAQTRQKTDQEIHSRIKEDDVEFAFSSIPSTSTPLPDANTAAQRVHEERFRLYQESRIREQEEIWKREQRRQIENKSSSSSSAPPSSPSTENQYDNNASEDDIPFSTSKPAVSSDSNNDILYAKIREKLERMYQVEIDDDRNNSLDSITTSSASLQTERQETNQSSFLKEVPSLSDPPPPSDTDGIDEWTRRRIQSVIESRAKLQAERKMKEKKKKAPIEDNTLFLKYKQGTLISNDESKSIQEEITLPPFPSDEYCTGFWRMIGSPTGFPVEEGVGVSDNLILRVDGTTAGGPILDTETRQKAAGGNWKLTVSQNEENDESTGVLRIRLLIPPKKERVLVMEGKLEKISMKPHVPLAGNTFGIPALEEAVMRDAAAATEDIEDSLYCNGSVWIEDATQVSKRIGVNRDHVGTFSIMKINTPSDPSQFTITIPRSVRNQD